MYNPAARILIRNFREGPSNIAGFADDYAFLVQALLGKKWKRSSFSVNFELDLYECTLDIKWLNWAVELQQKHDELFYDTKNGGVFSTTLGDPSVLVRMKEEHDGAEPSNQSVAVLNWLRLSNILSTTLAKQYYLILVRILASEDFKQKAEKTLTSVGEALLKAPMVMPLMVCALNFALADPMHVVISGPPAREDTLALLRTVHSVYLNLRAEKRFSQSLQILLFFVFDQRADIDPSKW